MNNRRIYEKLNLDYQYGLPDAEFTTQAWASEPLKKVLKGAKVSFALAAADAEISLLAKHNDKIVGQCSANKTLQHWQHLETIDPSERNLSTQLLIKIETKAIEDEKRHLDKIEADTKKSIHSTGIAVLPEYRGKNIGNLLRAKQIEMCQKKGATTLLCETTNKYSAKTVESAGFFKIAEYPYKTLAVELNHPPLAEIEDAYSVWCRKI